MWSVLNCQITLLIWHHCTKAIVQNISTELQFSLLPIPRLWDWGTREEGLRQFVIQWLQLSLCSHCDCLCGWLLEWMVFYLFCFFSFSFPSLLPPLPSLSLHFPKQAFTVCPKLASNLRSPPLSPDYWESHLLLWFLMFHPKIFGLCASLFVETSFWCFSRNKHQQQKPLSVYSSHILDS